MHYGGGHYKIPVRRRKYLQLVTVWEERGEEGAHSPERAALEWMSKYVELTGRTIEWWQFITEWAHLSMPLLLKNMPEEEVKKMAQLAPSEAAKIMCEKTRHYSPRRGENCRTG
ncbi:hypothetical protein CGL51_05615 [Pyrobaculum aerophilum]|uniref:Uncharacterized protein n=1 Tax=Pyrobaculum aerophilum TaxID=13773 RepID=A0A371QZ90_9CREN|nr:hypothetical protein CGL51_05615 [Pyrobaculum aerophilum]